MTFPAADNLVGEREQRCGLAPSSGPQCENRTLPTEIGNTVFVIE